MRSIVPLLSALHSALALSSYQNSTAWLRAVEMASKMTNHEKMELTTGVALPQCVGSLGAIPRLGIPSLCFMDGPSGIRPSTGVSAFPAQVNLASTWDDGLIFNSSFAMGQEFRAKGVHVALGPVAGGPSGRTPYNGRFWEGYGAEPYLAGRAAYQGVRGLQGNGVIATLKHFIGYEQETYRWGGVVQEIAALAGIKNPVANKHSISVGIDSKTFREFYLWPFEEALRAGPGAVMCSYNRINGTQACANHELITNVLKNELQFPGFVVSDWFSVTLAGSTVATANAGLDVDMPGRQLEPLTWGEVLVGAVGIDKVKQERLDDMVHRVLYAHFNASQGVDFHGTTVDAGAFASPLIPHKSVHTASINVQADHANIIRLVAEESAVLLKNSILPDYGLPILAGTTSEKRKIGVFGTDAGARPGGPNEGAVNMFSGKATNNGTVGLGYGSASPVFPYLVDPLQALNSVADLLAWHIQSAGIDYPTDHNATALTQIDELAQSVETCLVFAAVRSGEAFDRTHLRFENRGDDLIARVADRCRDTIVITHIPGPTNMEIPANHANVTAILNAGYPGQESGNALVSILAGKKSPSGKLVYDILQRDEDYIPNYTKPDKEPSVQFDEGLSVDYRHSISSNLSVRYPFGYGLSFAVFEYSKIGLCTQEITLTELTTEYDLFDAFLTVTTSVKNIGAVAASEVAQLYLAFPAAAGQPPLVLRGYTKAPALAPGEERMVAFDVRRRDVSTWDTVSQGWVTVPGRYTFHVCRSSRDCPLSIVMTVTP